MSARHVRGFGSALSALVVAGAVLVTAPTAWAAPPSNVVLAEATMLDPPQSVPGTLEPAPVLEAMGVDADRSLRISVGWSSTRADVDRFVEVFPGIVERLRGLRAK